jgi:hypothetical protein
MGTSSVTDLLLSSGTGKSQLGWYYAATDKLLGVDGTETATKIGTWAPVLVPVGGGIGAACRAAEAGRFGFLLGRPSVKLAANAVRHGPMNPGPLAADIANTFRGGSYTAVTSSKPTTLYRVYSGNKELGSYWTRTKPTGPVQSIIDSALDPAWGNRATRWVQVQVPADSTLYEGAAAAQRGLVGGGSQVFVPRVDASWVVGRGGF